MKLSEFVVDKQAEVGGRWFHMPKYGLCALIARWDNPAFTQAYAFGRSRKALKRMLDGDVDPQQREKLDAAISTTILKGWGKCQAHDCPGDATDQGMDPCIGLSADDDSPIEYGPATSLELITRVPDFRGDVMELAMDVNNYREAELRRMAGNSAGPSNGMSSTAPPAERSSATTSADASAESQE